MTGRRSRLVLLSVLLAAALLAAVPAEPVAADGGERILSFVSAVTVSADGSLDVRETIRVVAEHVEIRHGIYRDFPTRYRGSYGTWTEVPFEVTEVLRDDRPEPWHSEGQDNGVRVYAGSKDSLVEPGEHTYVIAYRTDRQLGYFADHDELYWNATGNGWSFPIEEAEARVRLPSGATGVRLEAYTGPSGAKGKDYGVSWDAAGSLAVFRTSRPLGPKEGMTIVVMWPKGLVREPDRGDKARAFVASNRSALAAILGLLAVLAYYLAAWHRVGRDPEGGSIVPLFAAPENFSPAAVRFVKRMGYDHRAFTATIVQIAVKGHLSIEEKDGKFTLGRTEPGKVPLLPEEVAVLGKLFPGGAQQIELEQKNHTRVAGAVGELKAQLATRLERVYFLLNRKQLGGGIALSILAIVATLLLAPGPVAASSGFLSVWLLGWSIGVSVLCVQVWRAWGAFSAGVGSRFVALPRAIFLTLFSIPFIAGELVGIGALVWMGSAVYAALLLGLAGLTVAFHYLLKAPTSAGRKVLDRIEGFALYLEAAESDRFKRLGSPERTPELYERFLPYAIALDLEERWSGAFEDVLARAAAEGQAYSPVWYHGDFGGLGWSTSSFAGSVGGALSGAISSSSTAPGSSSGGGGGGSSGGGGGGGGGGGW